MARCCCELHNQNACMVIEEPAREDARRWRNHAGPLMPGASGPRPSSHRLLPPAKGERASLSERAITLD